MSSPDSAVTAAEDKYRYKYLIAIAVTMAAMLELIDTSIVNVAIPHMMGNLGATLDEISWVSVSYIIANVIVIPMSGWLSAYFGRRRYLTASIAIFVASSFFCGAAHSLGGLVFWRVVQGLGGGALLSTAQSTLWEAFPPKEVGIGQAMFGIGVMVGPTLGPTLGGYIVDNYDWPWIFYINLPLGVIAGWMVWSYVRDSDLHEKARRVDWLGIGLLTTGVGALQWMLERGERYDWFESRFVTGLGVTALVSFVWLVWHELTTDEPVINFRVLHSRQLATGVAMASLLGFALFGSVFVLPVFLQGMLRMTAWQTGMVILPGALATAASMAIVGRLARRLDARPVIMTGMVLFFLAMWRLSTITVASGADDFFWPLIWRGLGLGMMFVPLTNLTLASLDRRELGAGAALSNFARQLGGSLGIAGMATMLTRFTHQARAVLGDHVAQGDPMAVERVTGLTRAFQGRGMDLMGAQRMAYAVMERQLAAQASVIAFSRVYLVSGIVLVATLPLLFMVRRARPGPAATVPVHAE